MFRYFLIFLSIFITPKVLIASENAINVQIIVPKDVFLDYQQVVQNQDPIQITNYSHKNSRRDVVELILVQQALALGGLTNYKVEFVVNDSYKRSLRMLINGTAALSGTSMWSQDIKNNYLLTMSKPLIKLTEFEAGLYTSEKQYQSLSTKPFKVEDITVVSSSQWTVDWKTLKQIPFAEVLETNSWASMVKMVNANRANVLLAPFQSSKDMSLNVDGITLKPLPNIKIGLFDSRHIAISKKNQNHKVIFQALQLGITKLDELGMIRQAYIQSGFINELVANWQLLSVNNNP